MRPDMTVLNGDGLVGRVKTVGPSTSTVLLAVDPESSVGVRLEGTMEVGFTTGQGAATATSTCGCSTASRRSSAATGW